MICTNLSFVLLFVDNPAKSAEFYSKLFGMEPAEQSPTFAMFPLPTGIHLGLWSKHTAEPVPVGAPGMSEIALIENDIDGLFEEWSKLAPVAMPPTDLDFGRTFVILDPDGHRIRVFRPEEG